jgi:oligopeptide/dipeptide ABC transporter ATP-binding protein
MSVIIITHDLAVASMFSENVIVMYAGRIVERAPMSEFITNPCHPYSKGLLKSTPVIGDKRKQLDAIPGQPPNLMRVPTGCPFAERCSNHMEKCFTQVPPVVSMSDTHSLSCWIYADKGVNKVG